MGMPDSGDPSAAGQAAGAGAAPPELLSNDPDGFGWGVLHDRTPKLIAQIRDAHPYGPDQRQALSALLEEITSGTMQPLDDRAHDQAVWNQWGAAHFGKPWADVPFLWWESYFYRRLLDAVDFFGPGPWFWIDPFEDLKAAELRDARTEADLAALDEVHRLPAHEEWQAKLQASLWGNQADLGFRIGATGGPGTGQNHEIVVDDSTQLRAALEAGGESKVSVVADNAGQELLSDLVLIDLMFETDIAAEVKLHLKPYPYYVSDATASDLIAGLRRLAATSGEAAEISHRLREAISVGRLKPYTHDFYCAPWSFHHMPADLAAEFATSSLVLLKGDLNYRRLVGDRDWPPITPFAEVAAYFPGPVAVLRTLKSDVVTGMDPAKVSLLDAAEPHWKTRGTHGLIQVRP
jgi:hypothetical protein